MNDQETLYRRVQRGKRYTYEPAGIDWGRIMLPEGAHLVTITATPSGTLTSMERRINPDRVAVLAAIREFEGELVNILRESYRKQADTSRMSKKQVAAWKRFEAESGLSSVMLSGPDAWKAARAAADFLEENA